MSSIYKGYPIIEMVKSFRSTYEIASFSNRIIPEVKMIPIDRRGVAPSLKKCLDEKGIINCISKEVMSLNDEGKKNIGIICKNQCRAENIYKKLKLLFDKDISLLTSEMDIFPEGVIITTVSLSKGLEFDAVIVPDVNEENYYSEHDRKLLYIACMRALHRLVLLYTGKISKLLPID
ncbi:MAG: ATP-binding domain-containing protein [Lachnospiraceae bacterium]|nr:ATP-binding domain-containing protein [Lachnospiraceae bacterium]